MVSKLESFHGVQDVLIADTLEYMLELALYIIGFKLILTYGMILQRILLPSFLPVALLRRNSLPLVLPVVLRRRRRKNRNSLPSILPVALLRTKRRKRRKRKHQSRRIRILNTFLEKNLLIFYYSSFPILQ